MVEPADVGSSSSGVRSRARRGPAWSGHAARLDPRGRRRSRCQNAYDGSRPPARSRTGERASRRSTSCPWRRCRRSRARWSPTGRSAVVTSAGRRGFAKPSARRPIRPSNAAASPYRRRRRGCRQGLLVAADDPPRSTAALGGSLAPERPSAESACRRGSNARLGHGNGSPALDRRLRSCACC